MFTAPSELCCVGLTPTELVTCAPLRLADVRWTAPRLMAWPFMKALRFVTVTAFTLCAFTKFTLRTFVLKTLVLRMNVLRTLIRSMKSGRQPNQGKNGSPKPSGNQPIPPPKPTPALKPKPPPRQPTKAVPKIGGPQTGPAHQPQPHRTTC